MAKQKATIKQMFDLDDQQRYSILEKARACAALSKPHVLPEHSQQENQKLPENNQSVGSGGTTHTTGRLLSSLYPSGAPWFTRELAAELKYDDQIPVEFKQEAARQLFLQELTAVSILESANSGRSKLRKRGGFRSRKRMAIDQFIITGDCLEQMLDDYRVKVFRRDQYVTVRDSSTDILYHIVRERIDPFSLSEEQFEKTQLKRKDLEDKTVKDRMCDIYTRCEWNPTSKTWVVEQECNNFVILESEEPVTPFFSTPFELVPGENYGRGLVELNLGDLRSLDALEGNLNDMMALAAKSLPAIDHNSTTNERDLEKESGTVIRANVSAGKCTDVAFVETANIREFQMLSAGIERKTKRLGKAFMLDSETQPEQDRVTRFQAQRIAQELDAGFGGIYTPIADEQQIPMVERLFYQLERDNLIAAMPKEGISIRTTTGMEALERQRKLGDIMNFAQVVTQLGPQAMGRINEAVLIDVMSRYQGIYEPGLIKSDEQLAQEQQAQQQQQAQMAAAQQAIQSAGKIAETGAQAQMQKGQ